MRPAPPRCSWFPLFCALLLAGSTHATNVAAQRANPDDPYRYDLRVGVFPLAFVAGISQSSFGSGLRGELDASRRLVLQLSGRLPWLEVAGEKDPPGFALRVGLLVNLVDDVEISELAGTVHPEDTAAPGGRPRGTDRDLEVTQENKIGWSRMVPPDRREGRVPVRHLQSLRLGYDLTRAIERARPTLADAGDHRYMLNTLHALYLGYGFGAHWNLSPATAGEREVGWRRFYFDAVFTLEPLVERKAVNQVEVTPQPTKFFPVGVRIGMEGAIAALMHRAPGVGFGYNLELGALPGYSGLEGYLLVGLGLALDMATGP